MSDPQRYHHSWDKYWTATEADQQPPLWDCAPEHAGADDVPRFAHLVDPELPLIDVGCGNGTQTRYLAGHFPQVIGADVSEPAVRLAAGVPSTAEYLALDLLDPDAVHALYERIGEANLYMRGVLHQILPEHREAFMASMRTLLGDRGLLYLVELTPEADVAFQSTMQRSGPIPGLLKVLDNGIRPGGVGRDEVLELLGADDYTVLAEGETAIHTTWNLPDAGPFLVPAMYLALRRNPE